MKFVLPKSRLLLLFLFWDPTKVLADDPSDFACNVCGEGGSVGDERAMVTTDIGIFTCQALAGAGLMGTIPEEHCSYIQRVASENCQCIRGPTGAPTEFPSGEEPDPLEADPTEELEPTEELDPVEEPELAGEFDPLHFECPICGVDGWVGVPDAIVQLTTGENQTCEVLETAGRNGEIPEAQCSGSQKIAGEMCQCKNPADYECSICGEGNAVTIPGGLVQVPGQVDRVCSQLARSAEVGNISAVACDLLAAWAAEPCGCTPTEDIASAIPSDFPSLTPTSFSEPLEPTMSPAPSGYATLQKGCFDNLADIHALETNQKDASMRRRYILCPDTTFHMGTLNSGGKIVDGEPFIMLRPNVIYQCGEDGSRLNNCVLKGGDFAVTSYYGVFEGIYETVENVEIKGLSFYSQNLFAAVMEAAGDITFTDCAFKMQGNLVPVLMQWRGLGPESPADAGSRNLRLSSEPTAAQLFHERRKRSAPTSNEIESDLGARKLEEATFNHIVTFRDCVFRDNFVVKDMGFPGIIENSFGSELNVINCLFQDNVYGDENNAAPFGYAIRSFGPLNVESSCFIDNTFSNHGPINLYGAEYTAINNHVLSSQAELDCEFIALFTSLDDMVAGIPLCIDSDAGTCAFSQPPTMSPTEAPTDSPSQPPAQQTTKDNSTASPIRVVFIGLLSVVLASLL